MQTFALNTLILNVGDVITHKQLRYTATIKSLHKCGSGLITVEDTPENKTVWDRSLPFTFKAMNIASTFKKQLTNPKLDLL